MDPRLGWGSVAALGLSLVAFGLAAPGAAGPLGVSLAGWAAIPTGVVLVVTGIWGFRNCDPESERVAFAHYAAVTLGVILVLLATVAMAI